MAVVMVSRILYMVDDKGTIREVLRVESNQVEGLKKQAAIINALNQSAKVEDVSDNDANADADADADADLTDEERTTSSNTTQVLDTSLNLVSADNTEESVTATQRVDDAYKGVVNVAQNTFGTGIDVETPGGFSLGDQIAMSASYAGTPIEVSLGSENEGAGLGGTTEQLESSFSDNEKRLQQELEAAQAALDAAFTNSESTLDAKNNELLALNDKIAELEKLLGGSATALEESTATIEKLNEELANANSAEQIQAIYDEQFAKASAAVTADLQAQYDKALAEAIAAAQAELGATAGQASTTVASQPGNAAEVVINPGDALSNVPVEQQTYSSNTVTGGQMQQAASTSVGAAEDAAIDLYTSGVRGTILTTPGGLLTDLDDENLRAARV